MYYFFFLSRICGLNQPPGVLCQKREACLLDYHRLGPHFNDWVKRPSVACRQLVTAGHVVYHAHCLSKHERSSEISKVRKIYSKMQDEQFELKSEVWWKDVSKYTKISVWKESLNGQEFFGVTDYREVFLIGNIFYL